MQSKKALFVFLVMVVVLASAQPVLASSGSYLVPLLAAGKPDTIADRYIVVFKDSARQDAVSAALARISRESGVAIHFKYSKVVKGFAATLPPRVLEIVRALPDVAYVEADQVITIDTIQYNATWGLDRINQRNLPLNGQYSYTNTGAGVKAYIIDTGIRFSHTDFEGRAILGVDEVGGGQNGNDCNGHGTHVAGTVGGKTYGVAKKVTLVAVRVLNCSGSGTTSGVVAGIDWVTSNHQAGQPAVANMSLGGGASTTLDNAVNRSINDGVTYAIAAGNSGANACNYSPARVAAAITVGATDKTDTRPSWSNYGSCLDIFAPGVSITSDWYTSNTATNTISGTSMATPHVTGVAALYLQSHPTASPSTVRNALVNNATTGVVKSAGTNSPNRLLFTNY